MIADSATGDAVLIPSGGKMKSYAVMRSLHQRGVRTLVASEYERTPHFSSRYCSERIRITAPSDDLAAYRDELLLLASRLDVKTIIPVRECDVYLFAKYREEFDRHVSLVSPPLETLTKAHDRLQLAREAEAAGVPTPETRLLSDVDDWDEDVVVKSRFNLLVDEYVPDVPPDTVEEMKRIWFVPSDREPDIEEIRARANHDPIVQEFVPQADKHLYCALWDHGEPVATYQHKQVRQNSWVGGGGVYRVSARSEAVERAAYDLLSHLNWHGFACIEYIEDAETGEWKFLEVNPRIWQSLPEAVRAGVDFPYYYWLLARGERADVDGEYELGVSCHNAYGEVAHLLSLLRDDSPFVERPSFGRTLWDIAASCLRNPRFEYIRRDDPRLFLSAMLKTTGSGVTKSREYNSEATKNGDAEKRREPEPAANTIRR